MRVSLWLLLTFGVMLLPFAARALPALWSETELMDASDLVVDAECVAVVREGEPLIDPDKITTTYRSTLWPSATYKGGLPASFQIIGISIEYTTDDFPIGWWWQTPVAEGWVGKLYLEQEDDGTYTKVWWNGMEEDPTHSDPKPLPLPEPTAAALSFVALTALAVLRAGRRRTRF